MFQKIMQKQREVVLSVLFITSSINPKILGLEWELSEYFPNNFPRTSPDIGFLMYDAERALVSCASSIVSATTP